MINRIKQYTNNVVQNEPMSLHTTFKIGGNADIFIAPSTITELQNIISELKDSAVPYIVIGNGSNLLVSDKGIEGAVICTENLNSFEVTETKIYADAGLKLSALASAATKNSLSGLEFAAGIPGSVGGAVFMNAGAYDGEIKNVVDYVRVLYDGEIIDIPVEKCCFGYRKSLFQQPGYVVLGACFSLDFGNKDEIQSKVLELNTRRKLKQPLEFPSAGSVFKRPEGHFAGKLIEDARLGGFSMGGAQVSEKHCGFIINRGGATAGDVLNLIKHIKMSVYVNFGVRLQEEIKFVGRR